MLDEGCGSRLKSPRYANVACSKTRKVTTRWLVREVRASNKKDLEVIVKECIGDFLTAVTEKGLDKTLWTSTTRSPDATLNVDGHMLPWAEKITYVGANIHLCSNSGSAMTNRLQKGTDVFEK